MQFESIIKRLPKDSVKANILHNLEKLDSEEAKERYKNSIVASYPEGIEDSSYLFFEELYPEIKDIHLRISYSKYDKVSRTRKGVKCKLCKNQNTESKDKPKGGGDEYIPTEVHCFDCNKTYLA